MTEKWHRYEARSVAYRLDPWGDDDAWDSRMELQHYTFVVEKVTPKGVWLMYPRRFVLRDARKRFACPTEREALDSFLARNQRHQGILKARLSAAEDARLQAVRRLEKLG